MNNLANNYPLKTYLKHLLLTLFIAFFYNIQAQEISFDSGKKYTIGDISVLGNTSFSSQTIVTYSGLRKGDRVYIPGEKISNAIKKLWKSNLFSDIELYVVKIEDDTVFLEIRLSDLPELNNITINGIKNSKKPAILKENKLIKGTKVTENLITTTKNYLTNKYRKEGFLNTKVELFTSEVIDSIQKKRVDMVVNIDKGNKIKVKDIVFKGNQVLKDKKLKKAMKNTKVKNPIRFLKRSKYIEADFKEDLEKITDKYKERGFRDARIIKDSVIINTDNTITINIDLEEGEKYTFGKIDFVGVEVARNDLKDNDTWTLEKEKIEEFEKQIEKADKEKKVKKIRIETRGDETWLIYLQNRVD